MREFGEGDNIGRTKSGSDPVKNPSSIFKSSNESEPDFVPS